MEYYVLYFNINFDNEIYWHFNISKLSNLYSLKDRYYNFIKYTPSEGVKLSIRSLTNVVLYKYKSNTYECELSNKISNGNILINMKAIMISLIEKYIGISIEVPDNIQYSFNFQYNNNNIIITNNCHHKLLLVIDINCFNLIDINITCDSITYKIDGKNTGINDAYLCFLEELQQIYYYSREYDYNTIYELIYSNMNKFTDMYNGNTTSFRKPGKTLKI